MTANSPAAALGRPRGLRDAAVSAAARVVSVTLGAADGRTVGAMALRELNLILRSRHWHRFAGFWLGYCCAVLFLPLLIRGRVGSWASPTDRQWFVICGVALQLGVAAIAAQWCIRRFRREIYTHRLDELMMTRCSAADIALGEALAAGVASLWLIGSGFPVCLMLTAMAGGGLGESLALVASLLPAAILGICFGMGWGLSFTGRRSMLSPITDWWLRVPLFPVWVAWAIIGFLPVLWAILSLIPGGLRFLLTVVTIAQAVLRWSLWNLNPLLVVPAIVQQAPASWWTTWTVLALITVLLLRKSMDTIQTALTFIPETEDTHAYPDVWVHHDVHYFVQYGRERRRVPNYRDGGNALTAFDVALGHRIYLHPFFWALGIHLYAFLTAWSLCFPQHGLLSGAAAVLFPATGALLLMSGGVAVSFGWERDQHRWPALAVLPLDNWTMAWGKINGVVRPTLWLGLLAAATAVALGWRGALPRESSLWMALHVLVFPVSLAAIASVLALTTETVSEALYRWAVLGAVPLACWILPHPIGGGAGLALPFSPPLLVLLLVLEGATPELVRAAWTSLGLELLAIGAAGLLLYWFLRQWSVGEKD